MRIIGLFSNALEDPGLISSQGGQWPGVPDVQLDFLAAQLKRIKLEKYQGAVLLATHHPPFIYAPPQHMGSGGNHSSSSAMLREIDQICQREGVYPHAFLAAHAHNYQRYARIVEFAGKELTCLSLSGGHNVNPLMHAKKGQTPPEPHMCSNVDYLEYRAALKTKELLLEKYDDINYGYLRIHVDREQLKIGFHKVGAATLAQSRFDMVTVDLAKHEMVAN